VPTLAITLVCLAYWNYKSFRDGWYLFRRSLLIFVGMLAFVVVSSAMIYNRAWEAFEPAEPAHGAAKLTLANPPSLNVGGFDRNILVKLTDGRVWLIIWLTLNLIGRAEIGPPSGKGFFLRSSGAADRSGFSAARTGLCRRGTCRYLDAGQR